MYVTNKILMSKLRREKIDLVKQLSEYYHPIATNIYEYYFKQSNGLQGSDQIIHKIGNKMEDLFQKVYSEAQEIKISEHDLKELEKNA